MFTGSPTLPPFSPLPFYVSCLVLAVLVLVLFLPVVVVVVLLLLLCSQVLLIQKIGSIQLRTLSCQNNVLHLKPGVGQINIAMHASITRCLKCPPFSFLTFSVLWTSSVPKCSHHLFFALVLANAGYRVGLINKFGHPAHRHDLVSRRTSVRFRFGSPLS